MFCSEPGLRSWYRKNPILYIPQKNSFDSLSPILCILFATLLNDVDREEADPARAFTSPGIVSNGVSLVSKV